jgi:hypothetical protein
MSCNCKNTPEPPNPPAPPVPPVPPKKQLSFLEIVNSNSVTPPNSTYKMRLQARVGNNIYKGNGFLTYTSDKETNSVSYYFQTILDGPHAPFIPPVNGLGFGNKYEIQSHDNGTHYIHSFITNKVNITDINTNFHISAEPASCCCCDSCCKTAYGGNRCDACNTCSTKGKCCFEGKCG